MDRNTELRKLPAASLSNIANILEINEDWQKIVPLIPKNLQSKQFERKYNYEEIKLMENHAKETKRKYAEVLFDEWGTSGRVRPTLDTLMKILQQAQIFRAADEVARMIGEPAPPRPVDGPAAAITINLTNLINEESVEQRLNSMRTVDSDNLNNSSHDQVLCNGTTRQLRPPPNLIAFSEDIQSANIPNIHELQSVAQEYKKEVSNMIKFSGSQSTLASENVPALTALLSDSIDRNPVSSVQTDSAYTPISSILSETDQSNNTDTSTQNDPFMPGHNSHGIMSNMDIYGIIDMAILEDKKLVAFDYKELEMLTNKFCETFVETAKGPVGKIGSGGFGDVYVGTHKKHGALAIKRVRGFYQISCDLDTVMKIFNTEVKSLSHLRHENIVPIFGYSIDGPAPCVVCKYIDGGSLQAKIAAKVLTERERVNIMTGTAEGLKYIHHSEKPQLTDEIQSETESLTSKKSYYLHGDVKSANILLTKDCVPKLCDFGLAKQLDTTLITKSMMGTSAYMAPEGFSGTITQKNDIFSFGIVLLELITGLKPIVTTSGENINIKNYVEENSTDGDITQLLDRVVPKWTVAQKVYELAQSCLRWEKNKRPSIDYVCNALKELKQPNEDLVAQL
ncbi:uncharacterized protein LOC142973519 [Anticarsia gemmatalis]|uniref:uncharacterized protein LOC142973519 n=1 Tax=Anticarsia gemmatalis TaxID=129554 RepID=UPI003F75C53C